MLKVVEISECFPNKFKPVWGDFILQHVRALSAYCSVITLVPLRFVPPRELFSFNPAKLALNFIKWISGLISTQDFEEKNLRVIYLPFFSLPRPYFDSVNRKITKYFFYSRIKKKLLNEKPDIIYCNWIRPWAEVASGLSEELDIPLIIDHHEDIPTLKKLYPEDHKIILKQFENADGIVVHSSVNKSDLENEKLVLPEIKIIYLGQRFPVIDNAKEFNFSELKLVCISHLSEPRKNIDVLLNAMKSISSNLNSQLLIGGDGVLKQHYERLSESLSLEKIVSFAGPVSQDEVRKILDASDIFVLPSFPEAFGVVFIEALARGLPVITCKGNGGGEELLKLGYPVILAEPGSPVSLSDSVIALAKDKEKMKFMSESGKEIVTEYFSWEKNARSTFDYILNLSKSNISK